jgi:hypothetical protein
MFNNCDAMVYVLHDFLCVVNHDGCGAGGPSTGAPNGRDRARSAASGLPAQASEACTAVGSFEVVTGDSAPAAAADRHSVLTPLAVDEWATYLDVMGRIADPKVLWSRVYRGGVSPGLRKEVRRPPLW